MKITEFYDMDTHSFTYVIHDEETSDAIVIDPILDGPEKDFLFARKLNLRGILETHIHADHLTGSQQLKKEFPQAIHCIGHRITEVQKTFKEKLHLEQLKTDGSQFDYLLTDHESKSFGSVNVKTIPTPGHTPCCLSFLVGKNIFTGDALFMPDFGTGRCDFPGGDPHRMFKSITDLYKLGEETKVFVGHDYCPNGRELAFQTTIGESKKSNKHIRSSTTEQEYVSFREERDKTLEPPKDLERNIAFNICAGKL